MSEKKFLMVSTLSQIIKFKGAEIMFKKINGVHWSYKSYYTIFVHSTSPVFKSFNEFVAVKIILRHSITCMRRLKIDIRNIVYGMQNA